MTSRWWERDVGYQVYVRSFADGNGDGVGDLLGLRERLGDLEALGVDLLWLTPFYPSPGADHGYDVADYHDVADELGGLAAFDDLIEDVHTRGMRLLVDLVPNHTSDQHPWFQAAMADPDAPERDYYIFRDPAPDGGPPNNWLSHFGGPAWTLDPTSGRYYCHLFLPAQPDLNWTHPDVRAAFERTLRFWLDRGADGFRIDVAHSLIKDPGFRDNPIVRPADAASAHPRVAFHAMSHDHDLDQPGVTEIYRSWRQIADEYDACLVGEVYLLEPERLTRYVADDALHSAFCFPVLKTGWEADEIRATLVAAVAASHGRFSWPLSSHDDPRAAERFGGGAPGAERSLAYFTLLAALPGLPFVYQGDELGLDDPHLPEQLFQDPAARGKHGAWSRDGSRTPLPWSEDDHAGFSPVEPWLPIGDNHRDRARSLQQGDPTSPLSRFTALLHSRPQWLPAGDAVAWLTDEGPVIAFRRGDIVAAANVGGPTDRLELPGGAAIVFASNEDVAIVDGGVELPTDQAVVVQVAGR